MKFSNILFLCLLVLFCLINCSDARKGGKGVGKSRRGGGKGKNNGLKKFKRGKNGGKKQRKNNKDDDEDDEDSNKKQKRKNKKSKKASKKTKKNGKNFSKKSRKGAGSNSAELKKKKKKRAKGCRHPDGATRTEGFTLTKKVSGSVPCYTIECFAMGKKKFQWMYAETKCVTCTEAGIPYMVGYVKTQKCFGPPPCWVEMCRSDGKFIRQGWQCGDNTFLGQTTTSSSGATKRYYFKALWKNRTFLSAYKDPTSTAFKNLDKTLQAEIASKGSIPNYKKSKFSKFSQGSVYGYGYIECSPCTDSEVKTGLTKAGATSVSVSTSSLTTTSVATTTA